MPPWTRWSGAVYYGWEEDHVARLGRFSSLLIERLGAGSFALGNGPSGGTRRVAFHPLACHNRASMT